MIKTNFRNKAEYVVKLYFDFNLKFEEEVEEKKKNYYCFINF